MSTTRFLLLALLAGACQRGPHPGFKPVAEGVYLKLHALGDAELPLRDGDSVLLRFRASGLDDPPGSFASREAWYLAGDLRSGALIPVLDRLLPGDSATVIAAGGAWPWNKLLPGVALASPPLELRMELALMDHRSEAFIAARREEERLRDPEGYEQRLIDKAIGTGTWTRWGTSRLYHRISGTARDTNRVKAGERVTVEWSGARIDDGQVFDATARHGQPFVFRFGDPDQVVEGIAVAVSLLREGQEGEFILPSELAFGARGLPGLVDPGMPVRYTVRLLRVERAG
jgi:FKBP-type peptidyl-prolyl cis-trans isomerase